MISRQDLSDFLRHQVVILLATAAVSQWLIPKITQSWQDHQRQTELKAQLATQSAKAVASMLMAAQSAEFGGTARNEDEIYRAFKDWQVEQVVVSARIRAYFADPNLAKDWDNFADVITKVYASGTRGGLRRKEYLAAVRKYFSADDVNWSALEAGYSDQTQFPEYNRAWFQMKQAVLRRYGEIIQPILAAHTR